jgi:hypothetical protein
MTSVRGGERRRLIVALWIAGSMSLLFALAVILTPPGRDLNTGPVIPGEGEPAVDLTVVDDAGMYEPPVTPQSRGGGPAGQVADY